ncbi:MAG: hypothetical protein U5L45_01865 [Saprospiraceae bacterium]|nr:hypothetical protein [Saprospiraceae bacterium]
MTENISIVEQKTGLLVDNSKVNFAIRQLALTGTHQYLYSIISEIIKVLSSRDKSMET